MVDDFWERFDEEVPSNLRYWVEYWQDSLLGITWLRGEYELLNPRTVLRELADEIAFNNIKGYNNLKDDYKYFFKRKLGHFLDKDPALKSTFRSEFVLLQNQLKKNNPGRYLEQFCRNLLEDFDSGAYYLSCIDALEKSIFDEDFNEAQETIRVLTDSIVSELLEMGYSKEKTSKIPAEIFAYYKIINDEKGYDVLTSFPHNVEPPSDEEDDTQVQDYFAAIKEEIDQLSLRQRVQALKNYAKVKPIKCTYIFQIRGLKGKEELEVGDVLFYSPHNQQFLTEDYLRREFFGSNRENAYMNAAIEISTIDYEAGAQRARALIDSALDLIRAYNYSEVPFEISSSYIGVDKQIGEICSYSKPSDKPMYQLTRSLEINKNRVRNLNKLTSKFASLFKFNDNPLAKQILDSLHWYRKALESRKLEDELLFMWIGLENLSNVGESKYDDIKKLIPRIKALTFVYDLGWDMFSRLRELIRTRPTTGTPYLDLPQILIRRAKLFPISNQTIKLQDFISVLPDIIGEIEDGLVKELLKEVERFYSDKKSTEEKIKEQMNLSKDHLLLIYRMRNRIVHKANYDNNLLPFYVDILKRLVSATLHIYLKVYEEKDFRSQIEIVNYCIQKADLMMERLKTDSPEKVLFEQGDVI